MGNQLVEVKDFPGFTVGDAIKIATHRLTQQGYRNIEPLPPLPRRAQDGLWRLVFLPARPLPPREGSDTASDHPTNPHPPPPWPPAGPGQRPRAPAANGG